MKILYKEEIEQALEKDDLDKLEFYLREVIKNKIDQGFDLLPGRLYYKYLSGKKRCCAIGSLVEMEDGVFYGETDIRILFDMAFDKELNYKLDDIAIGFDHFNPTFSNSIFKRQYVLLGNRLRREFYKGDTVTRLC